MVEVLDAMPTAEGGVMDIVITDYGEVRISKRSLAWLNSIDPEWRNCKRKRSKHAKRVQEQVRMFEIAVMVAASITWANGDELKEF